MQNRSGSSEKLIRFLEANNTGEKWLIAVPDAAEAEPIILATGKPVIAVGGFSGNDNTLTAAKLEELVASGQLKYFLLSDGGRGISNSEVTSWIKQYGTAVDSTEWSDSSASGFGGRENAGTLYDLSSYRASSKTSSTAGE
jgi:4-amino-4-deoxy-L-arabinose transferase-like glycosyltransferase